jgi:hypothetical protein
MTLSIGTSVPGILHSPSSYCSLFSMSTFSQLSICFKVVANSATEIVSSLKSKGSFFSSGNLFYHYLPMVISFTTLYAFVISYMSYDSISFFHNMQSCYPYPCVFPAVFYNGCIKLSVPKLCKSHLFKLNTVYTQCC